MICSKGNEVNICVGRGRGRGQHYFKLGEEGLSDSLYHDLYIRPTFVDY